LADVRQEIRRLEEEEVKLRAYLLEHPEDRTGEEHIAVIGSQSRRRVDLKALGRRDRSVGAGAVHVVPVDDGRSIA
jgi:hypothetical protein